MTFHCNYEKIEDATNSYSSTATQSTTKQNREDSCYVPICFGLAFAAFIAIVLFLMIYPANYFDANLPSIRVDSASVKSLTLNSTKLTSELNITLSITNQTDFVTYDFDQVSVDLFYMHSYLILNQSSTIPSFSTDTTRVIHAIPSVVNKVVLTLVADGIDQSLRDYGMVQFGIHLSASVRFKSGIFRSRREDLKVVCNPLTFVISSNARNNNATGILIHRLNCLQSM